MKQKLWMMVCLFTFLTHALFAQVKVVKGTIKSADEGTGLPGASVSVKGTVIGTITDVNGNYEIGVPGENATLVISFIGYKTQEIAVGSSGTVDATLAVDALNLDEVVVTAIGIQRDKKAVGYAVQEVSGSQITQAREQNVVSSLSGKVAGVQVQRSTGAAGGSAFIMIRGASSITGNNQPLFIVDGVPIDNNQFVTGNPDDGANNNLSSVAQSNRAIDIPQEDIESIQVLKGAAATALYGSQAGNGAIIITTKRGKKGISGKKGMNVQVSSGLDFSKYNKMVPLQNQYAQGITGEYVGPEFGFPLSWGPKIDTLRYATDPTYQWDKNGYIVSQNDPSAGSVAVSPYNNVDDFFRMGLRYSNAVSISGASDKTDYYFGFGNEHEDGIIANNTFGKTNVTFNGGHKLNNKVSLRSSVKYINSGGTRIQQGSNTSGIMLGLLRTPPTFDNSNGYGKDAINEPLSYSFADGSQRNYRGGGGYDNPFWTAAKNPLVDNVNRMIGNFEVNVQALPWLSFTYRPGIDFYSDRRKNQFAIGSRTAPAGRVIEDQFFVSRFNEDFLVNMNHDFSTDLSIKGNLGSNRRSYYQQRLYTQGDGLNIPDFYNMNNARSTFTRESIDRERNQAIYGQLEVDYKKYLILTFTGRNEWSTTLPVGANSFFYPSASAAFVFTDALGMSENKILPYGKFRVSYAEVGLGSPYTFATANYYTQSSYGDGWTNGVYFPLSTGVSSFQFNDVLGNPALRPERKKQFEIGTDLKFYNNRAGLDFTYYNSKSVDLIFTVPIARSSGAYQMIMNAGEMTNQGFEVIAYGTPVKSKALGLEWNIQANFTRNRNTVDKLADGVDNVFLGGFEGSNIRAQVGTPYGSIYGFGFYRDANDNLVIGADGFPIIDPNEKAFGSALPDWTMGITNSLTFKGLTFSFLFDIRQGGVMWNGTKGALYYFGTHKDAGDLRGTTKVFEGNVASYDADGNMIMETITRDGVEVQVPKTEAANSQSVELTEDWLAFGDGNGFFGNNTEDFIEKISWVRLRDITLSYAVPTKVLEKTPFTSAAITLSGRNVWLKTPYTGVDPETSLVGSSNAQGMDYFNMPNTKSFSIGLKFGF